MTEMSAPVKCTRARLIIELSDGRAVYWEARNPAVAEYESLPGPYADIGVCDLGSAADLVKGSVFGMRGRVALRITGGHPWQIRVEQDSGEIPPELAERVLELLQRLGNHVPDDSLHRIQPYLARIAGMPSVSYPFEPDWTMSPGAILRLELAERDVTEVHFAELSGLGAETVNGVIAGTVRVDETIAAAIARVIGTSKTMWLNVQEIYDEALARGAKDVSGDYGKDQDMGEMDAAARAAGYEVEARCSVTHGGDALLELPGEDQPVRVPLAEVAEGLGVTPADVPGSRLLVTVRESVKTGRVLSGFRPAES